MNTGSQSTSTTMVIMENISTLLDVHLLDNLNIRWTNIVANGVIIVNSCRVLRVNCAALLCFLCIIRSRGVRLGDFVCNFNRDTGLSDVIVHELICSVM